MSIIRLLPKGNLGSSRLSLEALQNFTKSKKKKKKVILIRWLLFTYKWFYSNMSNYNTVHQYGELNSSIIEAFGQIIKFYTIILECQRHTIQQLNEDPDFVSPVHKQHKQKAHKVVWANMSCFCAFCGQTVCISAEW